MAANPLVSVIIPYYNRKQYILPALEQLKRQTLKNIQFIMVDDGSTDDSHKFLRKAVKNDKRFTLLRSDKNQGPSAARNMG
jgi:CDP-glycerol glycerophosphotransferase